VTLFYLPIIIIIIIFLPIAAVWRIQ